MRTTRLSIVRVVVAALVSTGRGWVSKVSYLGENAGTYTPEHTHTQQIDRPCENITFQQLRWLAVNISIA